MSRTNTTKTKSWETKWQESCNKTRTCRTKSQKNTECHQKNSKATLLWPWSPKPWPPTCSSNTTTAAKRTLKRKISPHGENHFSKRRSESESCSENVNESKRYRCESRNKNSKSESESWSKGIQTENNHKRKTCATNAKTNETAKADDVKAGSRTKNESRIGLEKQLEKLIEPDLHTSSHLPFATAFTISIIILIYSVFTISIFIFNYLLLDHLDHYFLTFACGNIRVCKQHCPSRKTASFQAKTAVTPLATPDSTRSFRTPEPRPNMLSRDFYRNFLVPRHLCSLGRLRNPENNPQKDSFIFTYLDLSG